MTIEERVFGGAATAEEEPRQLVGAMKRGALNRCPACGEGRLFATFLTSHDNCNSCGETLSHHRADDLPAYLVILVVGHVIVGAFMGVEATTDLALWQHLAIWAPLTVAASLAMLRPVKGAVIGLQWALRMHGFGGHEDVIESHPEIRHDG